MLQIQWQRSSLGLVLIQNHISSCEAILIRWTLVQLPAVRESAKLHAKLYKIHDHLYQIAVNMKVLLDGHLHQLASCLQVSMYMCVKLYSMCRPLQPSIGSWSTTPTWSGNAGMKEQSLWHLVHQWQVPNLWQPSHMSKLWLPHQVMSPLWERPGPVQSSSPTDVMLYTSSWICKNTCKTP